MSARQPEVNPKRKQDVSSIADPKAKKAKTEACAGKAADVVGTPSDTSVNVKCTCKKRMHTRSCPKYDEAPETALVATLLCSAAKTARSSAGGGKAAVNANPKEGVKGAKAVTPALPAAPKDPVLGSKPSTSNGKAANPKEGGKGAKGDKGGEGARGWGKAPKEGKAAKGGKDGGQPG